MPILFDLQFIFTHIFVGEKLLILTAFSLTISIVHNKKPYKLSILIGNDSIKDAKVPNYPVVEQLGCLICC